jgi:hypothetical protein
VGEFSRGEGGVGEDDGAADEVGSGRAGGRGEERWEGEEGVAKAGVVQVGGEGEVAEVVGCLWRRWGLVSGWLAQWRVGFGARVGGVGMGMGELGMVFRAPSLLSRGLWRLGTTRPLDGKNSPTTNGGYRER